MLVRVGCEFVQRATMPTHAVLQVEPRPDGDFHVADASWDEQTSATSRAYVDALGNVCRRLTLPEGQSLIRFDAHVEVPAEPDAIDTGAMEVEPESLPDSVLIHVAEPLLSVGRTRRHRLGAFWSHPAGLGTRSGHRRLGARGDLVRLRK